MSSAARPVRGGGESASPPAASSRSRRARATPWWRAPWFDALQFVALLALLVWIAGRGAAAMEYRWQWYRVPRFFYRVVDGEFIAGPLLDGLAVTLEIAGWGMLLTIAIGLVTAALRLSGSMAGRALAVAYLEIVRNTPLLVQVSIFYFVLQPLLGFNNPLWAGIACLAFFEGAFASEVIRGAIVSVPRGQWEAAASVNLTRLDAYRFVVLPQAVPIMLPPMAGVLINLVKHSAILSFIAVFELTTEARNLIGDTFLSFEIWFVAGAMYLCLTITLSAFVAWLERRVRARG